MRTYIPNSKLIAFDVLMGRINARKKQIAFIVGRIQKARGYLHYDLEYEIAMDFDLNEMYNEADKLIVDTIFHVDRRGGLKNLSKSVII